ncbi:hypothetical protein BZG36_00355 [Bifiguratus adelaidae]|uniref:Tyrosine specific protein phosphatases domain-containing protein n=1 Tax=Bifiguratus adelaidae TaxID=1938954 RepID=A0A261Y7M4_9FUNG|nr:hypothetical protein BZG36_00355 [Bifiguratus adelaidae]
MEDRIVIKNEGGERIVGILHRAPTDSFTALDGVTRRPLGLICHGSVGHKNYLFQPTLARSLPFDTFRFDFRGNDESDGEPRFANVMSDYQDIVAVCAHFERTYQIYALIGHSRGAWTCLRYAALHDRRIPHVINISGRFVMDDVKRKNGDPVKSLLDAQGWYEWKYVSNRKNYTMTVTREQIEELAKWDNSAALQMAPTTSVMTVYGLKDQIVPLYNAAVWANGLPTHTLKLIPEGDHNFKGRYKELCDVINEYFSPAGVQDRVRRFGSVRRVAVDRWINVKGVKNVRDLGGWSILSSNGRRTAHIRPRMVFRGGELGSVAPEGVKTLLALRVKALFDLRSDQEIASMPPRAIPGVCRIHTPVFKDMDYSPEMLAIRWQHYFNGPEGFAKAYQAIYTKGTQAYITIFRYILDHPEDNIMVHCTAGKDRTGVFGMLLLGLCGVDDAVICEEYFSTTQGYYVEQAKIQEIMRFLNKTEQQVKEFLGSPYDAMRHTLGLFRQDYHSFASYFEHQLGFTPNEIRQLKDILIVDTGHQAQDDAVHRLVREREAKL